MSTGRHRALLSALGNDHDTSSASASRGSGPAASEGQNDNFRCEAIVPFHPTRSIVWFNCCFDGDDAEQTIFGTLDEVPGITVKVAVHADRLRDTSITLSMAVNKNDLSKPISEVEAEVSRFDLVWEPYILTENGFRVHSFDYFSLEDNEHALGEAHVEMLKLTNGDLKQLVCIDIKVNGYRVSRPYEPQYWTRLQNSNSWTHRSIEVCADILNSLANLEDDHEDHQPRFKFCFRAPCVFSEWERTCAGPFKQCVEEHGLYVHQFGMQKPLLMDSGRRDPPDTKGQTSQTGGSSSSSQNAPPPARGKDHNAPSASASEGRRVPGLAIGKSQSPTETVSDDRLAVTAGSPLASSPGHSRPSAPSVEEELEDRIVELEFDKLRYRRRIRELERENGALKDEAEASATQQRQAVASKQKDEQISELQAELSESERLIKDLLLERDNHLGQLEEYKDFVSRIRREAGYLLGNSKEDEASESADIWAATSDDCPTASDVEFPLAIPDPIVDHSDQELAPPSDQGFETEPLDEAEGFPDESDPQADEASIAAQDYDATIGEPRTSSPPEKTMEDHEQFNADWAAECRNLKKMKKSSKSKRRQQKKPTLRD